MIETKSVHGFAIAKKQWIGEDRLPPGSALFAIFGLSFCGWAVILAPLLAVFYKYVPGPIPIPLGR
jgi:hypothetical protein